MSRHMLQVYIHIYIMICLQCNIYVYIWMNQLRSCIYYISYHREVVYISSLSELVSVIQLSKILSMSQISDKGYLRREEVLGNVCAVFVLCGVIALLIVGVLTSFGGGMFYLNTTAIT
jgi:hypothetical protein